MSDEVELAFIVHTGTELKTGIVQQIVKTVERGAGISLDGTRICTFGGQSEPNGDIALALAARLEGEGKISPGSLERTAIHTLTRDGVRYVVATVPPDEHNAWVRRVIPQHLAKIDEAGDGLAWRPGWATLSTQAALAFVARARDATARRFGDVQIVVSLLNETKPRRIRKLMPGGYFTWADRVFAAAGVSHGAQEPDIAHWLVCADRSGAEVHLGYFARSTREALLPWDVLTRAEQRNTPRLG
jgi:hypothetical protein